MNHATDVLIIGGGVIGAAIAYNLRKRDIDVMVLERGEIGGQASSAAAGLLAPLGPLSGPDPRADLLLASFAMFPSLVPELEETSGLRLAFERPGALRTVRNPKRLANLQKRMKAWEPLGLQMSWLTGDEARQQEPLLGPEVCAAIYAPEESQINAAQVVYAFARAASKLGASLYSHTEAVHLQRSGNKITGVRTTHGEIFTCNRLILAPGAWASEYEQWLNLSIPVSPLRGQMLALQAPTPALKHIIFGDGIYIAPRGSSVIVGATKEEVGFDVQVTAEGISPIYETALKFIPTLRVCERERTWAGLRPSTPDHDPILGAAPGWENVILATGHNSVGIMLSPLTGQAIAELVATGHAPDVIRPFSLERFQTQAVVS